ncbi:hypothetical protein AAE02nite_38900 [Adhaeribacter aerolatus]|uniref:Uncharacterized protein n=1 Tax=Adhaeribacter aerolatus TaxID=670289 RepID=A0A512B2N2_9BACT|nr:hypothetical protein [Adhaeribacter aerolatus]GEO06226.1 hypothetical protein AAE02nite_38900 [Adhaeribacter aerolatus]
MTPNKISKPEAAILYFTFGLLFFGIVLSRTDRYWFDFTYTAEDGFIEWMTLLPLTVMMVISGLRLAKLFRLRRPLFLSALAGIILVCVFLIGEELSWGQRFLGLESSEFFKSNNSQKETNLHNLVIAGRSINLIIFSRTLILVMACYLVVLPILYPRKQKIKNIVDSLAIPVPQLYQIISFFLVFGLIALCPSGRRSELLEFCSCFLLLLIFKYPRNKEIYLAE